MFALSATGYRGAILALDLPSFVLAATCTVTLGLLVQAALLSVFILWREATLFGAIARAWQASLFAGFMGALASEFWFLAFALTTAANVRTLGLVEVLFAQFVAAFVFRQRTSPREAAGILLVVGGVALLLGTL
jgi:drug/metabolite transporter (DMT)-like permease